jgi:hypothetical protein
MSRLSRRLSMKFRTARGLFTGQTGKWSIVDHGRLWPQSGSAEAQEAPPPQMSPATPPSPTPEKTVPGDVKPEQEQRKKLSVPR